MQQLRSLGTLIVALAVVSQGCGSATVTSPPSPTQGLPSATASPAPVSANPATPSEVPPSPSASAAAAPSQSAAVSPVETSQGETAGAALQTVYAAVRGLKGDPRLAKLKELADAEGGFVTVYTSTNLDESEPLIAAFTDATGVDVDLYRASASTVLQRVAQETQAGFTDGADVIAINGPEMTILDAQHELAPLTTPATEAILPSGVFDDWSAMYLNVFVAGWNTDKIDAGAAPTTYDQLFHDYAGRIGMELGDWDWFATLVKYFESRGMTEDQAVQLFKDAAKGARVVDGHTLMTELLASGEFDITMENYQHRMARLMKDGAHIAWQPPVQPIVVRPNGIAISSHAAHPAASLLYVEYVLGDGQQLFLDLERTPASTAALGGLDAKYDVLFTDVQALLDESGKWQTLYEEVTKESGQPVAEQ